jgi:hypothetical protein
MFICLDELERQPACTQREATDASLVNLRWMDEAHFLGFLTDLLTKTSNVLKKI